MAKKTPNLIKKLFLRFASKPRVGPINSQYNNFKRENIFAGICTLVLSLCLKMIAYNARPRVVPVNSFVGLMFERGKSVRGTQRHL